MRRGAVSDTLALFTGIHSEPRIPHPQSGRKAQPKYRVTVTATTNPWIETTKPYITRIIGSDALGATTLTLLAAAWAPSTAATYGSTIRRYFDFCTEKQLAPLGATPAHMARYVAWLGQLGTIKASSLQ
jgi:hypothetical protein